MPNVVIETPTETIVRPPYRAVVRDNAILSTGEDTDVITYFTGGLLADSQEAAVKEAQGYVRDAAADIKARVELWLESLNDIERDVLAYISALYDEQVAHFASKEVIGPNGQPVKQYDDPQVYVGKKHPAVRVKVYDNRTDRLVHNETVPVDFSAKPKAASSDGQKTKK